LTIFDYIIFVILIVFVINGWRRGLFRSLIGPISFIFFTFIGIINFDIDQNLIKALSIVGIGTISSTIIVWLMWAISRRYVPVHERYYLFWGSRVLGSILSLVWEGFILAIALVLITTLPNSLVGEQVKLIIKESRSYAVIQMYLLQRIPHIQNAAEFVAVIADPSWLESVKSSQAYQNFVEHPKIQRVVNNAQIMAEIKNKDVIKLLGRTQIIDILSDEALMRQFTELTKMAVAQHTTSEETTNEPLSSSPKE